MQLWAVTMVRDELDVLPYTIAHLVQEGVDGLIVADNCSEDGTRQWLHSLEQLGFVGRQLVVLDDNDPAYYQSRKMTALYRRASELGADWVIPFDADEVWYDPAGTRLKEFFGAIPTGEWCVNAGAVDYHPTAHDSEDPNPFLRMTYREVTPRWKKVAVPGRFELVIDQGNHNASIDGRPLLPVNQPLEIGHFPVRSVAQFERKVRNGAQAYELATGMPINQGEHWRYLGRVWKQSGSEGLQVEYRKRCDLPGLVHAPVPWRG